MENIWGFVYPQDWENFCNHVIGLYEDNNLAPLTTILLNQIFERYPTSVRVEALAYLVRLRGLGKTVHTAAEVGQLLMGIRALKFPA